MCTASSLFQRNPTPPHTMCEGTRVSTYLALTFGTLLSSQRTDASITTLTGRSGRFPLGDPDTIRVDPTVDSGVLPCNFLNSRSHWEAERIPTVADEYVELPWPIGSFAVETVQLAPRRPEQ